MAGMDGEACVKQIFFEPPPDFRRRPPEQPCFTWLRNITNDLSSFDIELPETTDAAQNRSFWRLLASYSATFS